jgi:hypothetical protein
MSPLSYDFVDRWYLAGPMSNIPQFNVPAFLNGRDVLEARGLNIQLPADLDDPEIVAMLLQSPDGKHMEGAPTWGDCLAADVKLIADEVGGVIVLPGWKRSRGARLETFVCKPLCGKPVVYFPSTTRDLYPVSDRQLAEAWLGADLWSEITQLERAVIKAVAPILA